MTLINGGLFTLESIGLDTLDNFGLAADVTFVTNNGDTQTFNTGPVHASFQPYIFGLEFDEISSVTWHQDSPFHKFDDLQLRKEPFPSAVVPVPAAVWLFGSGLLGLVGMARRKKA